MTFHITSPWTDDRVRLLRHFFHTNRTMAQIASLMDMTRNAIIGKLHREKLFRGPIKADPNRPPRIRKKYVRRKKTADISLDPIIPEFITEPVTELNCSIADLTSERCPWVLGEPSHDAMYCGGKVVRGSYCTFHARQAYR